MIYNVEELKAKIREILKGIDDEEGGDGVGWWETSAGAKFGAEKLQQVMDAIDEAIS